MDDILLKNITLDDRQVDITIADGLIATIRPHSDGLPEPASGVEAMDCTGKVAVPGFINMHTHAAMSLMRGVGEDMVLQDWLGHIWAIESKLDAPFIYWGTKVAALEMIKTGTTTCNDHYWFSPTARIAAAEMGIRSAVSYLFLNHNDKEEAQREKEQCLEMYETVPDWDARSIFTIGIHAIYSVSEELILGPRNLPAGTT